MGVRGELFSTKVALQNRTYFFNVKENRLGDLYLNIVESKNRDEGGFDRQSVILFADDLQEFLKGFDESLRVLEKAVREKRKGPPNRSAPEGNFDSANQRFDGPRRRAPASRTGNYAESETYAGPRRGRSGREDEGGRSERPRRAGGEGRSYEPRVRRSPAPSNFRERQGRKSEGQDRPREGYRNKDKPEFTPRKRVVVKPKK